MGKFFLRMDQEMLVYFMLNPNLVGNGQGLSMPIFGSM